MSRGRPPKSTAQHKADGTYNVTRHRNRADVNWPAHAPEPPADLTPYAYNMWQTYIATCPPEMLSEVDSTVLEQACRWGAISAELTTFVEHNPLQLDVLKAAATASQKFYAYCSKLGLSPVDRARLKAPDPKSLDDDPLDSMLRITAG